jgi:hypothetical protein
MLPVEVVHIKRLPKNSNNLLASIPTVIQSVAKDLLQRRHCITTTKISVAMIHATAVQGRSTRSVMGRRKRSLPLTSQRDEIPYHAAFASKAVISGSTRR